MAIARIGPPILDDDDGHGNITYRILLSYEPDQLWIDAFDAGLVVASLSVPHVDNDEIIVTVPSSGSLDEHLENIDARIVLANELVR